MSTPAAKRRVVVAGVGYVGRRLLDALGNAATGLSRSSESADARVTQLDLDEPGDTPRPALDDYAVVYTIPPSRHDDDDTRLERFLGLLDAPPHRFVYLSTTGVYGDRRGATVDEAAPVRPATARARRRVRAESLLVDYAADNDVVLIVLRVPGIYGPGRLGTERLRSGEPVLIEQHANPGNRVHVDDLVRTIVAALDESVPAGVYNVGDGDERSSTWFANEVARQAGLTPPPAIEREAAERTFSPMRLSFLNESRRLDLQKMRNVLGVTPRYADAADGIAASLREESS